MRGGGVIAGFYGICPSRFGMVIFCMWHGSHMQPHDCEQASSGHEYSSMLINLYYERNG